MTYHSVTRPSMLPLPTSSNGKAMIRKFLVSLIISMLVISLSFATLGSIHYVEAQATQPQRYSSLPTHDGKAIRNGTFWKWIKDSIQPQGYKSMIFMFGQCYGGGFVNSLPTKDLPNTVAMSASKYDEESWAYWDTPTPPRPGSKQVYDEWLQKVRDEIDRNPEATMDQISTAAKNADRRAQRGQETPQISPATGNNMKIHEGKSNYVIMWGGNPNKYRYWNDLERMYGTLQNKFGYTDAEIFVLYGDGTGNRPSPPDGKSTVQVDYRATAENLETVIKDLAKNMNENETLLFWSSDHGDNDQNIQRGTQLVKAYSTYEFYFDLPPDFIRAVSLAETSPSIEITQQGIINYDTTIYINDVEVGTLNPINITNLLYFDKSLISFTQFSNTFTVISGQSEDFTVSNITLDSGAVPTQMEVAVGGVWVPVDEFVLLAPYIALASTILVATAATAIYVKRAKRRKEKQ